MNANNPEVLLIDDDRDICRMMESILKQAGFHVQYCLSPERVHQYVLTLKPRVIVMDMFLSGMDGTDICRKLKSDPHTSGIQIIMMSAHPDAEQLCRSALADQFISKPCDIDDFLDKVKAALALP